MFSISYRDLPILNGTVFEVTGRSTDFQPINTAWV